MNFGCVSILLSDFIYGILNLNLNFAGCIPDVEYLEFQVLELVGNAARDNKKIRIVSRHIQLAARNGEELSKLLGDVTTANGGVMPNIHNLLLPKKAGGSSKGAGGDDDS
ncbi:hypothetical protein QN277_004683 [Acacia crassicarpa]|uniref:Histone H2A n=1 Tax=Acacia crassicarpa TaxID=499986 RepID=A0AAE1K1W0_9FABA|nr:hypothetical protein QN277_004683 [Acacia crassicarpa]